MSSLTLAPFRAYDGNLGRCLSEDPIGQDGGINLYGYVANAPVGRLDPLGLWFGWDDAAFVGVGAVVGLGGRLVGDLVTGSHSTWEDYFGAALGGAAGGETLLYTANPYIAGAAGGLVGNSSAQLFKILSGKECNFDAVGLAFDTAFGAMTGVIPGRPRVVGLNAGRGSSVQIFRQIFTKASNGTIKDITASTVRQMVQGAYYEYAFSQGAAASSVASTLCSAAYLASRKRSLRRVPRPSRPRP